MMEWQPIESAPKDGSDVLFYAEGKVWVGHWWHDTSPDDYGHTEPDCFVMVPIGMDWNGADLKTDSQARPSHWMPLPEPPHA